MRLRPSSILVVLLIIALSIPPSLLAQITPAHQIRSQPRQLKSDALAEAINELLKLDPLPPESLDEQPEDDPSKAEEKPPADDAPIKELIAYWSARAYDPNPNALKPSDKVRQRLLEAYEDRPEMLFGLIGFLPETADTHDRLYKLLGEEPEDELPWKGMIQNWLQRNSRYFRDELIEAARGAHNNSPEFDDDLRSLARLDWETARPILETFASASDERVTPISLSLLYEHARQSGDPALAEKYRAILKAIVVNRQSPRIARQTALSSLMEAEWGGQEEWFVSLFADPTLANLSEDKGKDDDKPNGDQDGRVGRVVYDEGWSIFSVLPALDANAERWLPVISNLVGHHHPTVHRSAVRCLVNFLSGEFGEIKKKQEIAQKLAPWLTEPRWADADDRRSFIESLKSLKLPEMLAGLIWVLDNDEEEDNRAAAADALTEYRDPRAIPALRRALEKEEDEERRDKIVTALVECGGFTDDELAAAIEAYAKATVTEEGQSEIDQARAGAAEKPLPLKVSIGRILDESETIKATEGLAIRLFERARALRKTQPALARQILRTIEGVDLPVAEINLVERIGEGWADVDSLTLALDNRDSLRKSAGDELQRLIRQGGYAAGVAAAILNDDRERKDALAGRDAKVQLALLACSRYLRDKLPVDLAGKLLDSPNRALAKAAESYLEVEDSREARRLVLARHPGEAYVLGHRQLHPSRHQPQLFFRDLEEKLRREIKSQSGLREIYAVAIPNSPELTVGVIIRVRNDKAELSVHEIEGRRSVRWLTDGELEELKRFTSRQEVEDLGPESFFNESDHGQLRHEYLRLTKEGGRRIILNGLRRAPKNPTLHEELSGLFYNLGRAGEFTVRYTIEEKLPGVEVVFADKQQEARVVCGEGAEIRVLIAEKSHGRRRGVAETKPEWREFSSGKPGKATDEPALCRALSAATLPGSAWGDGHHAPLSAPSRQGDGWVYFVYGKDPGVWRVEPGKEPEKIITGAYHNHVITPDGKWLAAIKTWNEQGKHAAQLIRYDLRVGKEYPVNLPPESAHVPAVYVAAHGRMLLAHRGFHYGAGSDAPSYLLDPETGAIQNVKGEFRPLAGWHAREMQPTGNPNEFWAAIYDYQKRVTNIGRYNTKSFAFTPRVELPELNLSRNDFWVDAAAGKIWITYRGHLLRLPLPAQTK